MVPAPVSGKEIKQRAHAATWTKQMRTLAWVPSSQQMELVDLVSLSLTGLGFPHSRTE